MNEQCAEQKVAAACRHSPGAAGWRLKFRESSQFWLTVLVISVYWLTLAFITPLSTPWPLQPAHHSLTTTTSLSILTTSVFCLASWLPVRSLERALISVAVVCGPGLLSYRAYCKMALLGQWPLLPAKPINTHSIAEPLRCGMACRPAEDAPLFRKKEETERKKRAKSCWNRWPLTSGGVMREKESLWCGLLIGNLFTSSGREKQLEKQGWGKDR